MKVIVWLALLDHQRLLHLGGRAVVAVARLVGIDDDVAGAGDGQSAAADGAGAGAAGVDGENHSRGRNWPSH